MYDVDIYTTHKYKEFILPGFPFSTQTAVELSSGSKGHLAMPLPTPATYSCRPRLVRLAYTTWSRGLCALVPQTYSRSPLPKNIYIRYEKIFYIYMCAKLTAKCYLWAG